MKFSKFFFEAENLVLKPNYTLSIQKIFQSLREITKNWAGMSAFH